MSFRGRFYKCVDKNQADAIESELLIYIRLP